MEKTFHNGAHRSVCTYPLEQQDNLGLLNTLIQCRLADTPLTHLIIFSNKHTGSATTHPQRRC